MTISDYDNINEVKITRKELYDLAWSERLSEISKKYYISENGLIKRCQELNIPLPNLKYWISFKNSENQPSKIPLSKHSDSNIIYLKLREDVGKTKESVQKHHSRFKKEIENDSSVNLKVPEKLTNPDSLITAARDRLYKKEIYNKDQGIIYHNQGSIGIYVSPSQISRALRFMDTMIKALRNRGHQFINKNESAHVVVFGEDYAVSCKEKEKRVVIKDKYGSHTGLEPTGLLSFRLGHSYWLKEWSEGKIPIEEQVSKILASIEYRGWKDREERIESEKRWAIQKEKERIAKELQDRKEKEFTEFKELFKKSKRHEEAEVIRRYIKKLEDYAISKNELTEELKEKIAWARKKADWYDPFIEVDDELFDGIDRDELVLHKQSYYY
jgi:hypothetical protein